MTIAEAATELAVTPVAVRSAISRGRLRGEPIEGVPHTRVIARAEVERYKREREQRGWETRKSAGYVPSRAADYARAYRQRKAEQAAQQAQAPQPAEKE